MSNFVPRCAGCGEKHLDLLCPSTGRCKHCDGTGFRKDDGTPCAAKQEATGVVVECVAASARAAKVLTNYLPILAPSDAEVLMDLGSVLDAASLTGPLPPHLAGAIDSVRSWVVRRIDTRDEEPGCVHNNMHLSLYGERMTFECAVCSWKVTRDLVAPGSTRWHTWKALHALAAGDAEALAPVAGVPAVVSPPSEAPQGGPPWFDADGTQRCYHQISDPTTCPECIAAASPSGSPSGEEEQP